LPQLAGVRKNAAWWERAPWPGQPGMRKFSTLRQLFVTRREVMPRLAAPRSARFAAAAALQRPNPAPPRAGRERRNFTPGDTLTRPLILHFASAALFFRMGRQVDRTAWGVGLVIRASRSPAVESLPECKLQLASARTRSRSNLKLALRQAPRVVARSPADDVSRRFQRARGDVCQGDERSDHDVRSKISIVCHWGCSHLCERTTA
jgi:hypothetical protein